MLETRFKIIFLVVVLFAASLPLIAILRGTISTPFEAEPPHGEENSGGLPLSRKSWKSLSLRSLSQFLRARSCVERMVGDLMSVLNGRFTSMVFCGPYRSNTYSSKG